MNKTVTYSVVGRKDPNDKLAPVKYYAQAQARGVLSIREMCERIQQATTVTRADTMAVLIALGEVVADGLRCGEIVRLGDLGSLQICLSGKGASTEDSYHPGLITKARINFRPGSDLAGILDTLSYERVAKLADKAAAEDAGEPSEEEAGN